MHRCLAGDTNAFSAIVRRYEKTVYNTAFRMTRSEEESTELTQAVFVKVFEKLHTYNSEHRFFSWLYRICINESLNHVKQSARSASIDESQLVDDGDTADRRLERDMLVGQIRNAMLMLTDDQRIVLVLRHYRELSYADIADLLGIPEATVKSRLFSARRTLRILLLNRGVRP